MSKTDQKKNEELDSLELFAKRYFDEVSLDDGNPKARNLFDGLLPFFEAGTKKALPDLFSKAVELNHIHLASLCCIPPKAGFIDIACAPGALMRHADISFYEGHSLRTILKSISSESTSNKVAKALSQEIFYAYKDTSFESVLNKNTLFILCSAISQNQPSKDSISTQLFIELHSLARNNQALDNDLLNRSRQILFSDFLRNGSYMKLYTFFTFINNVIGSDKELQNKFLQSFHESIELIEGDKKAVSMLVNLLLFPDSQFDNFKKTIVQAINPDESNTNPLAACFKLIDSKMFSISDVQNVNEIIATADFNEVNKHVDTDEIYRRLNFIGFKVDKLDISKLGIEARGSALEKSLGF